MFTHGGVQPKDAGRELYNHMHAARSDIRIQETISISVMMKEPKSPSLLLLTLTALTLLAFIGPTRTTATVDNEGKNVTSPNTHVSRGSNGGGGGFSWGWGGGGGGGGGWGYGWGGGGGGAGWWKWGCGRGRRRGGGPADRGVYRVGEYGECMGEGRCKGMRLDCPLHCGGPCFYDCLNRCKSHCVRRRL